MELMEENMTNKERIEYAEKRIKELKLLIKYWRGK